VSIREQLYKEGNHVLLRYNLSDILFHVGSWNIIFIIDLWYLEIWHLAIELERSYGPLLLHSLYFFFFFLLCRYLIMLYCNKSLAWVLEVYTIAFKAQRHLSSCPWKKGHCCFPLKPGLEQLCVCFVWLRSQGCVSKRFSFFLGTFFWPCLPRQGYCV
jgi:hypothetical protein